ncbi:MAG TPA: hypothetical protein VNA89_16420 [Gemmatimonadaceae bacterium]|nr:hypothetical protein [Gemmatimonadaceae bacterium]
MLAWLWLGVVPRRVPGKEKECRRSERQSRTGRASAPSLSPLSPLSSPFRASYLLAWQTLRGPDCTGTHVNAHFNMLDYGVRGVDPVRDAETRQALADWLDRPRRDDAVDLSAKYPPACGADRACTVIPVGERPNTDFLWQRSPYPVRAGATERARRRRSTTSSRTGSREITAC